MSTYEPWHENTVAQYTGGGKEGDWENRIFSKQNEGNTKYQNPNGDFKICVKQIEMNLGTDNNCDTDYYGLLQFGKNFIWHEAANFLSFFYEVNIY